MKKSLIALGISAALVGSTIISGAAPAQAGSKKRLIGGAIGLIMLNEAAKAEKRRAPNAKVYRKSTRKTPHKATLNSRYSRSEWRQIQASLNNLGYNVGSVDGVLGGGSRRGISAFQTSRGEKQTGQLTRTQYAALVAAAGGTVAMSQPAAPVNRKLNRQEVRMVQRSLKKLGYYSGRIDGISGGGTGRAISAFLRDQGRDPYQTSPVEALVLAGGAAGTVVPPYLVQEASAKRSATGGGMFGPAQSAQQQPAGAGGLFGGPATGQQQQQQQPATAGLFGGASAPQGQVQPQAQPQMQPQTGQTNGLFAPNTAAAQPQAPVNGQNGGGQNGAQSSLDIYNGGNTGRNVGGNQAPAAPQQPAAKTEGQQPGNGVADLFAPSQGQQGQAGTGQVGAGQPGAGQAPQSNLDIFSGSDS